MKNGKKGYTLLELLVVIGIIAVLIGFGTVSYSTAQKKARDAKRRADLKAIQNAFEQAYSLNSYAYPAYADGGNISAWPLGYTPITFTFPTNPLGGNYQCVLAGGCTASAYTICPPAIGAGIPAQRLEGDTSCPTSGAGVNSCCLSNLQ